MVNDYGKIPLLCLQLLVLLWSMHHFMLIFVVFCTYELDKQHAAVGLTGWKVPAIAKAFVFLC